MAEDTATVRAATRKAWRAWLQRHHRDESEVWLVFPKKHTGKVRLTYEDAVEESLCFGWIDTTRRRFDADHYMQRFTPRKNERNWSKINLDRFRRMEEAGLMTAAGRARLPADVAPPPERFQAGDVTPGFIVQGLAAHKEARTFFESLAPGYRRDYIRWIIEARREETRRRRLNEAIRFLKAGVKRPLDPAVRRPRN